LLTLDLSLSGPNGAGKSALFRILCGETTPDSGKVEIGETVRMGHVTQSRGSLDENSTIVDEIVGDGKPIMIGAMEMAPRHYVAQFNFLGDDQLKPIKLLSGGERNRVHLAKLLKTERNVLLLDEPSNDLVRILIDLCKGSWKS
jgi:energy-dependent translational throttle protein EttA